MMKKIIIEVGSTNTKIDLYDGENVNRLDEVSILFKQNYIKNHEISSSDLDTLCNKINELKDITEDIYVCGTSIFRDLVGEEKDNFLNTFKEKTGLTFNIISQEMESELTLKGATRFVNGRVCVFVGGGGSTEITIYDDGVIESMNSPIGCIAVMEKFPDLADDFATTKLDDVVQYVKSRLNIPKEKADILILAGGTHEKFARLAGLKLSDNTLYEDKCATVMMDISTRISETLRFFNDISLDELREKYGNPNWWFATRGMCSCALAVAESIGAKYIVPTNISMVYGIIEMLEKK